MMSQPQNCGRCGTPMTLSYNGLYCTRCQQPGSQYAASPPAMGGVYQQPALVPRRTFTGWECPNCRVQMATGVANCTNCMFHDPQAPQQGSVAYPTLTSPTVTPAQGSSPVWKCASCAYEYNLNSASTCQRCTKPNPAAPPRKMGPVQPVNVQSNTGGGAMWPCSCGYQYNLAIVCIQCGKPKVAAAPPGPTPDTKPGLNPNQWACQKCGMANLVGNTLCNSCGREKSNPASYKMQQIKCKIKMNGMMWVCEQCGYDRNYAGFNTCKKCKEMNTIGLSIAPQRKP